MGLGMRRVTAWTRWLLLRITPELVVELVTEEDEMENYSFQIRKQL